MSDQELQLVLDVMGAPDVVVGRSVNVKGRGMIVLDTWLEDRGIKWTQRWQDAYNTALYLRTSSGTPVKIMSGAGYTAGEASAAEAGAAVAKINNIPYWPDASPKAKLPHPNAGAPIPPPPDFVYKKPDMPPPAAVTSDDPRAMAKMMQPALVKEYRSQQALRDWTRAQLDDFETREKIAALIGGTLTEKEQKQKAALAAQLAAAEKAVSQARADHEMLDKPGVTPKEVQDMLARRGVAVAVSPQTNATGTAYTAPLAAAAQEDFKRRWNASKKLYDTFGDAADAMLPPGDRLTPAERKAGKAQVDQLGGWALTDKGFVKSSGTSTTQTVLGHGSPISETKESTSTTTVGLGNVTNIKSDKTTAVGVGGSSSKEETRTMGADIIKGEATYGKGTNRETTDAAGNTTKTSDKTTYTAGMGGVTKTTDASTQVGSKLDTTSTTKGVVRGPGQLGASTSTTTKSGTMAGPPGAEKMVSGTEKTEKATAGLVSDEKGIGVGATAQQDRKSVYEGGKSVATTVAAGGRCQVNIKEIPGSEPVKFTITTTISFDLKLGASAGKEWENSPSADKMKDTGMKANVSAGGSASLGAYASFKRELTAEEAKEYVAFVQQNGRGSKLPEHKILATGASQGWPAAKQLWGAMNGSPDLLKTMKPGEEVESNVEVGGELKAGAGTSESRQGGFSAGGEVSGKLKHKVNIKRAILADGMVQLTATVDDEGELAAALNAGYGAASMKAGKSWTKGLGRVMVFVLDPKNPAFDSQVALIQSAATAEDLDRIAQTIKPAQRTNKTVEGEGTSVGVAIGPGSIDLGGKGKLTSEETYDDKGNLIGSKYTGENQGGGTVGIGDVKVGDTKSETYVGEVDKEGRAKGEVTTTTKSSSAKKTILGAGSKITKDPIGTIMNPGKLIEEEVESKGTAIADPEIMSVVWAAADAPKWNGRVGGHRHDDWVKCGQKIRAACVFKGSGRERELVSVDKHKVQAALAEWHKADVTGRAERTEAIIRPLGGFPGGKAFAFPDGTEGMKPDWDALVIADPLDKARELAKAGKLMDALTEAKRQKDRVASLLARVKTAGSKWEGLEIQHAEMMGHINTRVNEIDAEVRALAKKIPPPPPPPSSPATVPTAEEAKKQEMVEKTAEVKAWLETYNNNIQTMKGYSESVFGKVGKAEARINESWTLSSKSSRIAEVTPWLKEAEDLLKIWDKLYWETFRLYEKISPWVAVDRARVESMHPAGANGRWRQVYDQTRDKSMAGR